MIIIIMESAGFVSKFTLNQRQCAAVREQDFSLGLLSNYYHLHIVGDVQEGKTVELMIVTSVLCQSHITAAVQGFWPSKSWLWHQSR